MAILFSSYFCTKKFNVKVLCRLSVLQVIIPDDDPTLIAGMEGLDLSFFDVDAQKYSRFERCVSAFLSHYSLWKQCAEENVEYQIFEHDAVCVGNLPQFISHSGCISLGAPSYGKFNTPSVLGVSPLVSKNYFPGAHAYRLKPKAAKTLVQHARENAAPTDVYLSRTNFDWLQEYYPWPVEARDTFSTIQKKGGCLAKHNYGETYDLL